MSRTADGVYRRNRAKLLASSDRCWLCGHGGAATADHKIPDKLWPRDQFGRRVPGFDDLANLAPAHGQGGNMLNPCPMGCGYCNQRRGVREVLSPRSRDW